MYLPSNASLDHFPDNTLSTFKVKLPHPVELEGDWEVALADIFFPTNLSTLQQGGKIFISTFPATKEERDHFPETAQAYPYTSKEVTILHHHPTESYDPKQAEYKVDPRRVKQRLFTTDFPPNLHYHSALDFVEALNAFFQNPTSFSGILQHRKVAGGGSQRHPIEFRYKDGGLAIHIRDSQLELILSPPIARVLGFPGIHDKTFLSFKGRGIYHFPHQTVSLIADQSRIFYVYSNISSPIVVGDVMASALRSLTLPTPTDPYQVTAKEFKLLHYVKVALKSFQVIEIYLRDPAGQPVPFQSGGIVQILLHFRHG